MGLSAAAAASSFAENAFAADEVAADWFHSGGGGIKSFALIAACDVTDSKLLSYAGEHNTSPLNLIDEELSSRGR